MGYNASKNLCLVLKTSTAASPHEVYLTAQLQILCLLPFRLYLSQLTQRKPIAFLNQTNKIIVFLRRNTPV